MKNSKNILSSLVGTLHFYPLTKHKCFQKFIALLPPRFQKAIAFIYIENKTLFVALAHPGYKMELNYNKDLFKSLLQTFTNSDQECQNYSANKVVFFNSKYHMQKQTATDTIPYYHELSTGKFETTLKDTKLKEQFETIKELIQKNIQSQNEY